SRGPARAGSWPPSGRPRARRSSTPSAARTVNELFDVPDAAFIESPLAAMKLSDCEVVVPSSPEEAARAFGDGGVTVIAGGTIVMPRLTIGRVRPERALLLARAGLDGI